MGLFRIAYIGDKRPSEDDIYKITSQHLANVNNEKNETDMIELVNLAESKDDPGFLVYHAIMYDMSIHDNPEQLKSLQTILDLNCKDGNLALFPFTKGYVSQDTITEESNRINDMIPREHRPVTVYPMNLMNKEDLIPYLDGVVLNEAINYMDLNREVANLFEEKRRLTIENAKKAFQGKERTMRTHIERVSKYSTEIAKQLDWDDCSINSMEQISYLHDIGKLLVPNSVLGSEHSLSNEEYKQMSIHTPAGEFIIDKSLEYTEEELKGITDHHKGGSAYADIIKIADCIDAMSARRHYNNPKNAPEILLDLYTNSRTPSNPERKAFFSNQKATEAAICLFSQAIATEGIDPVKMIESVLSQKQTELQQLNNIPDSQEQLQKVNSEIGNYTQLVDFLRDQKIEVTNQVKDGEYNKLGFKVNKIGQLEFETDKDITMTQEDQALFLQERQNSVFEYLINSKCRSLNIRADSIEEKISLVTEHGINIDELKEKSCEFIEKQDSMGRKCIEDAKNNSIEHTPNYDIHDITKRAVDKNITQSEVRSVLNLTRDENAPQKLEH